MNKKNLNIILEENKSDFIFKKSKSNLNISFNRVGFIFFIFSVISIIYTIHLTHLGLRKINNDRVDKIQNNSNKLYIR